CGVSGVGDRRARLHRHGGSKMRITILLAAGVAACAFAGASHAAVTSSFNTGLLTASADAAGTIAVTCNAGKVAVNGAAVTGDPNCSDVTAITLNGSNSDDVLDVSGVAADAGFSNPALAANAAITLVGNDGADFLDGSPFRDVLEGGQGDD